MYLSSLIGMIGDSKLYIEIKEKYSGASFGFYTKNDINNYFKNYGDKKIVEINSQYIDNKRVLVVYFI
jgi:hypothetical protein